MKVTMGIELSIQECEATLASLVRLKFDENDDVPGPYFGSPFLAQASSKVLAALIDDCDRAGDVRRAAGWRRWREWSGRTAERRVVVRRVAASARWDEWTPREQRDYFEYCVAPFLLTEEDMVDLAAQVRAARR
ncbi:hypothetical protein ACFT5B_00190 [Luteimicrobium sp. NPDC057192]|uniref:hypothetical protein n=1 Tax=Luteimicrobium sp. NPDC057192 TaxID=3346042 RepID=UPI00363C4245